MVSKVIVKWLKLTFVLSTASFLIIQIQMRRGGNNDSIALEADSGNPHMVIVRAATTRNESVLSPKLPALPAETQAPPVDIDPPLSPAEIRQIIENHNAKAEVYNEAAFGPVESVDYVLVVQVHNRTKYLEQLIDSLSQATGIDRTLLIFSHDYYSDTLNQLIRKVTFCRVMQIFYPYSMQVYPDRFPGQDPKDCRSDIGKEK